MIWLTKTRGRWCWENSRDSYSLYLLLGHSNAQMSSSGCILVLCRTCPYDELNLSHKVRQKIAPACKCHVTKCKLPVFAESIIGWLSRSLKRPCLYLLMHCLRRAKNRFWISIWRCGMLKARPQHGTRTVSRQVTKKRKIQTNRKPSWPQPI